LCLPEYFPERVVTALRTELSDGLLYQLHLDSEDFRTPIDLLYSRFIQNPAPEELRNAANLVAHHDFSGRLIWLSGMTSAHWPGWKRFLCEYEPACRGVSPLERTLFVVPLCGELALDPPPEDVCLKSRWWKGVVDYIDILLFSSIALQARADGPLVKNVAISVVAALAVWDPEVVLTLSRAALNDILNPAGILSDLAKKRGWAPRQDSIQEAAWYKGYCDIFGGRTRTHSALLAIQGQQDEIQRRIWSAQVSRLLPYVEERRQDILTQLAAVLRVPFPTRFGEIIDDVRDLEIGHIEAQLKNGSNNCDPELLKEIERLRDIRNRLAHLETVPSDLLVECACYRS
jgi:hypothetical protein